MRTSAFALLLAGAMLIPASLAAQAPAGAPMAPPPGGPGGPPPGGPPPGGFPNMPSMAETDYEAGVTIANGALVDGPGHGAIAEEIQPTAIRGLTLSSSEPALNGVIVQGGQSAVTLNGGAISLSGPGTNDFLGTGAGVLVRDGATLVLDGTTIETSARISSAAVAAENARLRIYNARLVANGGPLPEDYRPIIGPGMMEPPAPLGLEGTARTVLAMSNSDTLIVGSHIEAAGWGAVSTDATGGDLHLKVADSTIVVRGRGYGTYADFGAHVEVENSRIDSGGPMAIIAGKARTDFARVTGHAAGNVMMIHSVMAFDPTETAEFALVDSTVTSAGPSILVKSANAAITIAGGSVTSDTGVLLEVRRNDDPNATQTGGRSVPGVTLTVQRAQLAGDVIDTDPDRATSLTLDGASLSGALHDVTLHFRNNGSWLATADSTVALAPDTDLAAIDARSGVTITVSDAEFPERRLASGGTLVAAGS